MVGRRLRGYEGGKMCIRDRWYCIRMTTVRDFGKSLIFMRKRMQMEREVWRRESESWITAG